MSALFLWCCLFRVQAMMTLNGPVISLVLLLSSLPLECPFQPQQLRGRLSDHVSQTRDLTDPEPSRVNGSAQADLRLHHLHCLGPSNCKQHLRAFSALRPTLLCDSCCCCVFAHPGQFSPSSKNIHSPPSLLLSLLQGCFQIFIENSEFVFPCSDNVLIF